jgi:hypothetical protein
MMTSGGTGGSTGGTGGSTGGTSATGGTGGTTGGTGGTTGGTGGSTGGTGGSTGGAGGSTGGTVSMGGMGAGAGVGPTTGGASGSGSSVGGGAGMGTGGSSGGMPGTGGSAGTGAGGSAGMGAGGAAALDPATLIPGLDGWYWEISTTNGDNPGGNNYWLSDTGQSCPQNSDWNKAGLTRSKDFQMKGTAGTKYTITFELRGAMGFRCYSGGTSTQTQPNANGVNNGWYVGGQQANNSIWNTYELDVQPAVTGEANTYFLNGLPYSATAGICDQELTYEMHTKGKFVVMGDSTLHFWTHDTNCKAQQNCGPTPSTSCVPRQIDLSGMSPAAMVNQPVTNAVGASTFYPQWFYFDVQTITSP